MKTQCAGTSMGPKASDQNARTLESKRQQEGDEWNYTDKWISKGVWMKVSDL